MAPRVLDVSKATDSRLYSKRGPSPIGLVVHTTAGVSSLRYLQGAVLATGRIASADALIDRDGTINVIVPFDCYSYHAGVAHYVTERGITLTNINELFLGIELEARVTESCTPAQYDSLAGVLLNKAEVYHWPLPYVIIAHSAIALPFGRRSDPVNFNWGAFYSAIDRQSKLDWWRG